MSMRKWIVRSIVVTVAVCATVVAVAFQRWTNPEAVREQVLARLREYFPNSIVELESAHLRLLGGIHIRELRLSSRDETGKQPVIHIPSGTIFHDKEQLLGGRLAIRKLELHQPRIHAVRRANGTWNFMRILAPPDLRFPIPTIVLQQAKLAIEDRLGPDGASGIEVQKLDVTIINDPHNPTGSSEIHFRGSGLLEGAESLLIDGRLSRRTHDLTAAIRLPRLEINPDLQHRLATYWPEAAKLAKELSGHLDICVELKRLPAKGPNWQHNIHGRLTRGTFRHSRLPCTIEQIDAAFRWAEGRLVLEHVTAVAWGAQVTANAIRIRPGKVLEIEADLETKKCVCTPELLQALPEKLREILKDYSPRGPFALEAKLRLAGDQWSTQCRVQPAGMSFEYARFRYPASQVTGQIDYTGNTFDEARPHQTTLNLRGLAGGRPVFVEGTIKGGRRIGRVDVRIWGKNLPFDHTARNALEETHRRLADEFHPTGLIDFEANVRKSPSEECFDNRFLIRLHDGTARYDVFPYPLENVTGELEILRDHWEFRDFQAMHRGGSVTCSGATIPGSPGRVRITIDGKNILMDDELERAILRQGLKETWRSLAPTGRMNFTAQIETRQQQEPRIKVTIQPLACTVRPEFLGRIALTEITGTIQYRDDLVTLTRISARAGPSQFSLEEGKVSFQEDGAVAIDLADVLGNPVMIDATLTAAMPKGLSDLCKSLQIRHPMSLRTRLMLRFPAKGAGPAQVYWDGGLRLKNATVHAGLPIEGVSGVVFCRGRYEDGLRDVAGNIQLDEAWLFRQKFQNIHTQIRVDGRNPNVVEFQNLKARVYGGDIGGSLRLECGPPLRYQINLTGAQMRLEEFARHNRLGPDARLSGLAGARLYLRGEGEGLRGMAGAGTLDVPNGKIGKDLPLLLDLLKVLSLRMPDKTAFEEARVQFRINGPVVRVTQLDLFGNSVSLSGQGTLNVDGTNINLDFFAVWGRIMQLAPPVLDRIPPLISKQLLKIKMRGEVGKVECVKEPVPILVEPVRMLLERASGRDPPR